MFDKFWSFFDVSVVIDVNDSIDVSTLSVLSTFDRQIYDVLLFVVHARLVVRQELCVDVDGLRVLHVGGVDVADRAAWVGLLQVLKALVQIVLEKRYKMLLTQSWKCFDLNMLHIIIFWKRKHYNIYIFLIHPSFLFWLGFK